MQPFLSHKENYAYQLEYYKEEYAPYKDRAKEMKPFMVQYLSTYYVEIKDIYFYKK